MSYRILQGDALTVLRTLPAESVNCCVTSPPYWGLRDYKLEPLVWGGDAGCEHEWVDETVRTEVGKGNWAQGTNGRGELQPGGVDIKREPIRSTAMRGFCSLCGAWRGSLGLEPTPELYVAHLVEIFREVRRVLRSDGTLWLNLGDSYAATHNGTLGRGNRSDSFHFDESRLAAQGKSDRKEQLIPPGLKPKDLIGIPWRVARALQEPYYAGKIKDERERIWLAAMVEAEGCMFIHRRGEGLSNGQGYFRQNASFGAGLEVASTDRVIAERCMDITRMGSICEQTPGQNSRRKQTIYRWNLRTNVCRDVIRELYPYMIAKQHEARILLGCPSSGPEAEKAWMALKAIHQGATAAEVDFPAPPTLYEQGWWLRSDVIWSKSNPMPESVTDRPTKAHEYIFLLSKSAKYYYDAEAIKEPFSTDPKENYPARARITGRGTQGAAEARGNDRDKSGGFPPRPCAGWHQGTRAEGSAPRDRRGSGNGLPPSYHNSTFTKGKTSATKPESGHCSVGQGPRYEYEGRNRRSVWTVSTYPVKEAHFATYPPDLIEPCILAGCPPAGKRCDCDEVIQTPLGKGPTNDPTLLVGRAGYNRERRNGEGRRPITRREQRAYAEEMRKSEHRDEMQGLAGEAFAHYIRTDDSGAQPLPPGLLEDWLARGWLTEPAPCRHPVEEAGTVLDPFAGSGTTGLAAIKHGRQFLGIELNPEYIQIAEKRMNEHFPLFAGASQP